MKQKKKRKGQGKGQGFEREVCKSLSLWITNGKRADIFWRSAMSGGRARIILAGGGKAPSQVGDVSITDRLGHAFLEHFIVECKFYRDLHFLHFFTGHKTGLPQFWVDLKEDCKTYGKKPFLVAKQNFIPVMLLLDTGAQTVLSEMPYPKLIVPKADLYMYGYEEVLAAAKLRARSSRRLR